MIPTRIVALTNKSFRHGLSERVCRRKLLREGYEIWRGGLFNILRDENYPNVEQKYRRLQDLLEQHHPGHFEYFSYVCAVHHGMPDFVCYKNGKFLFIECKLSHEQLLESQKKCMQLLLRLGFTVEIHIVADEKMKMTRAVTDIRSGKRLPKEKQLRLKKRW